MVISSNIGAVIEIKNHRRAIKLVGVEMNSFGKKSRKRYLSLGHGRGTVLPPSFRPFLMCPYSRSRSRGGNKKTCSSNDMTATPPWKDGRRVSSVFSE